MGLQLVEGGIGHRSVELPLDDAGFIQHQNVGVVRRGESGGLLEFLFVVVDQEEMCPLIFGRAALDAVRGHAANQARHIFQHSDGVQGELAADALRPRLGLVLRSVSEAHDDNGGLAIREFDFLIKQVLAFNGGELLCQQGEGDHKRQQPHGAHPGIT